MRNYQVSVVREIRMLRLMWRELETYLKGDGLRTVVKTAENTPNPTGKRASSRPYGEPQGAGPKEDRNKLFGFEMGL